MIKKYLVATADHITGEINYKHIEAESDEDAVIEEYIDSMGVVLWCIYEPSWREKDARFDFEKYVRYCIKNNIL